MIHHLSIAARDPQHVAEVLAEFMGGAATRFTPNPGSWFAHQHDEYGTGVEIYPAGTELRPAGPEGAGFAMTEPIRSSYSPTHFALSVPISQGQIAAIAEREGWQCYCCERGAGGFHVMEVWIENTGMVELLTPAFQNPLAHARDVRAALLARRMAPGDEGAKAAPVNEAGKGLGHPAISTQRPTPRSASLRLEPFPERLNLGFPFIGEYDSSFFRKEATMDGRAVFGGFAETGGRDD